MPTFFACSAALLLLGMLADAAPAQQPGGSPPVQVLFLGTYHFANPGQDVVKTEVADVLSPGKQAEIAEILDALARFRPTRVAVEAPPEAAPRLDSLYRAYRAGSYELPRNEREQLGFRLAARLGHDRVYPIDHAGEFPFGRMMEYAQRKEPAFAASVMRGVAEITAEENRRQKELSIGENLRERNHPARIARDHGLYTEFARVGAGDGYVGAGDGYVGADLLSAWYERNIRIFANLQRIAEPGDRIVVIFGSGHAAILRELIGVSPGMVLVEAADYLPPT